MKISRRRIDKASLSSKRDECYSSVVSSPGWLARVVLNGHGKMLGFSHLENIFSWFSLVYLYVISALLKEAYIYNFWSKRTIRKVCN